MAHTADAGGTGPANPDGFHPFRRLPPGDPAAWPSILGGKGASLARMWALGLPVPPGFTVPVATVRPALAGGGSTSDLDRAVDAGLADLEASTGRRLGVGDPPLVVSVRSGAPVSMPGMLDTVLNVGLSAEVAEALCRSAGDDRFGWAIYHRFIVAYVTLVGGATPAVVGDALVAAGVTTDRPDLTPGEFRSAAERLRARLAEDGHPIPVDPRSQVRAAAAAVAASWGSPRASAYRRVEGIADDLGTAVTVQTMVFGNRGGRSGSGVAFSRDPSTGEPGVVGEFLVGAQGDSIVAGGDRAPSLVPMAERWPDLAVELGRSASALERVMADAAEIEFTVEDGRLWFLQARVAARSEWAALRMAVDMAADPDFPLDRASAVARVAHLLDDPPPATEGAVGAVGGDGEVLITGLGASPGWASGVISVDPDDAVRRAAAGDDVILVRPTTSPADVHGLAESRGVVTSLGGLASHAAVVARSWGLPAVVGADGLEVVGDGIVVGGARLAVGDVITVDGDRGRVLRGAHRPAAATAGPAPPEVATLRRWRRETGGGEVRPHGPDRAAD